MKKPHVNLKSVHFYSCMIRQKLDGLRAEIRGYRLVRVELWAC